MITGANFTGANAVKFNATSATSYSVNSATQITATVPSGATTGVISVTTSAGTGSSSTSFTYLPAPTIGSFTPSNGAAGTTVTINGTNFVSGGTTVKFNTTAASSVTFVSTSQIKAVVAAGTTSGLISATTNGGTATSAASYGPTISTFTPASGGAGTSVVLTGTNFVAGASVKFNGVSASSIYNSATQLTATVPSGATSGPISVTVSGITGTSLSSFGFLSAPTISSFNPGVGQAGAQVVIAGANLSGATAVKFNGTSASYSVNSANQITATVPNGATTGAITVTTPGGTATSANFTVAATTPATVGSPLTLTLSSGQTTYVTFNATAGEHMGLGIWGSTMPFATFALRYAQNTLLSTGFSNGGTSTWTVPDLTSSGTYVLAVDPGSYSGSVTIQLSDDVPVTGTLGGTVKATMPLTGQDGRVTFTGSAGEHIGIGFTNNTFASGCCAVYVTVLRPDGTPLPTDGRFQNQVFTGSSIYNDGNVNVPTLPLGGTYTILLHPYNTTGGSVDVTLSDDAAVPIAVGSSSTVTTSRVGQNGRVTFAGRAGEHVGVGFSNNTIAGAPGYTGCCNVLTEVLKPDGTPLTPGSCCWTGPSIYNDGNMNLPTLPVDGDYTIVLDPQSTGIGSVDVTVSDDVTAQAVVDGQIGTLTTTLDGQNSRVTFDATQGQRISIGLSDITIAGAPGWAGQSTALVSVIKPDGTVLTSSSCCWTGPGNANDIDITSIPVAGTYTVFVDPQNIGAGSISVTVSQPQLGLISEDGGDVEANIARAGQDEILSFTGATGDDLNLQIVDTSLPCCDGTVTIADPNGATIVSGSIFATDGEIELPILTVDGTYTVTIDQGSQIGYTTVALTDPPPPSRSVYMTSVSTSAACNTGTTIAQEGKFTKGAVILDFGRPAEQGDVYGTLLLGSNAFASNGAILAAAKSFASCYYDNARPAQTLVVALGTNNYHQCSCPNDPDSFQTAGQRWGSFVEAFGDYLTQSGYAQQVFPGGADDAEPAWDGAYQHTHDFIAGYNETSSWFMFNYGSMEGGYWTRPQEFYVSFGGNDNFPVPEIYISAQVPQWGDLDLWAAQNTPSAMWFIGVMTTGSFDSNGNWVPYMVGGQIPSFKPRTAYVKMLGALQSCNHYKIGGPQCSKANAAAMYQRIIQYLTYIQ